MSTMYACPYDLKCGLLFGLAFHRLDVSTQSETGLSSLPAVGSGPSNRFLEDRCGKKAYEL
jgi:hypothetical protein